MLLGSGDASSDGGEFELERKLGCSVQTGTMGQMSPQRSHAMCGFRLIVRYQENEHTRVGFVGLWVYKRLGIGCWSHHVTSYTALGLQEILTSEKDWMMWPPGLELFGFQNYE